MNCRPSTRRQKEAPKVGVIGRAVEKVFWSETQNPPVEELFKGTVTGVRYDVEEQSYVYHIVYEDNDEESVLYEELEAILVAAEGNEEEEEDTTKMTEDALVEDAEKEEDDELEADDNVIGDPLSNLTPSTPDKRTTTQIPYVTPQSSTLSDRSLKKRKSASPPKVKTPKLSSMKSIAQWGLPRGALARCPNTNFTVRALDSIPPNPTQPSALLPGRLLLVEPDQAGICPKDFVGRAFESSSALHQQIQQASSTKIRFATYELMAVSDPSFSSWEFATARLDSISLDQLDDSMDVPRAILVRIFWDGESTLSSNVSYWKGGSTSMDDNDMQWALMESRDSDVPPVLLGVPTTLLDASSTNDLLSTTSIVPADTNDIEMDSSSLEDGVGVELSNGSDQNVNNSSRNELLPQPTNPGRARIKLAASLLQKAIRRSRMLSSPAPLLEACRELIHPKCVRLGSTFAFLKTLWSTMLTDVAPFDDATKGCLGLPSVLLLSLLAKAKPSWTMPHSLCRAAVASALRTAYCRDTKQWVGFVERNDDWHLLEVGEFGDEDSVEMRAANLRNILRATQAVAGDTLSWGKWNTFVGDRSAAAAVTYADETFDGSLLPDAPLPVPNEKLLLNEWENGRVPSAASDMRHLDQECRLAAIEPSIFPYSLVLLQAILTEPPTSWKKHSLPNLSRQVRKLITEANPRLREQVVLARLATWGKDKNALTANKLGPSAKISLSTQVEKTYKSFREVITPTGTLSAGETEVVNCFEAIQKWQFNHFQGGMNSIRSPNFTLSTPSNALTLCRVKAGPPLSKSDGRIAFILLFGVAVEVKVHGEVVSAMFCGDVNEPLLVQRIGKARREGKEMATAGGATSGATAVPSLGYLQRGRSDEEAKLMEAAENAVAAHWRGGKQGMLPRPPAGFQWEIGLDTTADYRWDAEGKIVEKNVDLFRDSRGKALWKFKVSGVDVQPYDARNIMSPCRLDISDPHHVPVTLDSGRETSLRTVLYVHNNTDAMKAHGATILEEMSALSRYADVDRANNPNEGLVYDWLYLAQQSPIPARTWRDALLAIRTRNHHHVLVGQGIKSDGSGAPRDMTEGVLVRIFHALECLYPMALRKEGAFKFRVRPLGASYYHLLCMLERLGVGLLPPGLDVSTPLPTKRKRTNKQSREETKRPKRTQRQVSSLASKRLMSGLSFNDENDQLEVADTTRDYGGNGAGSAALLPGVTTKLWDHQQASCDAIVRGIMQGKRGHADASAVGAGKTLTALATIVRVTEWLHERGKPRHGSLVMLPTKALIREWLREIATHTMGFHIVEQREDGVLFSLTYNKKNCPVDCNTIVISTLDRVCNHPFIRQTAWDFVVIDECLSVQNAKTKRTPSAWRQIEIATCGVLMLSATFFRSKYNDLFYMIRMLRSPLPRTKEWLPATIHEHIVCQIPETDRSWQMQAELVSLSVADLQSYRSKIDAFKRRQLNDPERANGLELFKELRNFLRVKFEGRSGTKSTTYETNSIMAEAFAKLAKKLLRKRRRPLIFADTNHEAAFLVRVLKTHGLAAKTWTSIATNRVSGGLDASKENVVIVAVKTTEGSGLNMQHHADTILCRPTVGDHLEQMKGRIDRPGQTTKDLQLYVVVCEHSLEETAYANINLAGNFFREYIAPVAERFKESIDLKAVLTVGGKQKLQRGTVLKAWRNELEISGQSGCFASITSRPFRPDTENKDDEEDKAMGVSLRRTTTVDETEPKYKPRNTVRVNKGDPQAVKEAKERAKNGEASSVIREWLLRKPGRARATGNGRKGTAKGLAHKSFLRYSDQKPPLVLNATTVREAITHLSRSDPKLADLIARVGADALISDIGEPKKLTQGRLFDQCLRAITFTMVSVEAGNVFLRKLAIKIGALLETFSEARRLKIISQLLAETKGSGRGEESDTEDDMLGLLLEGRHEEIIFTHSLVGELVKMCYVDKGKRVGHPHLSGETVSCGKNDDPAVFLERARRHARGKNSPVSAGYSIPKAGFIISLVDDFNSNKISGEMIAAASDREAFGLLTQLKGIADWSAGQILMHQFNRADIFLYGDLTVRNYLNDLYDINHADKSETLLESAADFDDTATNRDLIDELARKKGWQPYRSVVNFLMYHLQEENLVLL